MWGGGAGPARGRGLFGRRIRCRGGWRFNLLGHHAVQHRAERDGEGVAKGRPLRVIGQYGGGSQPAGLKGQGGGVLLLAEEGDEREPGRFAAQPHEVGLVRGQLDDGEGGGFGGRTAGGGGRLPREAVGAQVSLEDGAGPCRVHEQERSGQLFLEHLLL